MLSTSFEVHDTVQTGLPFRALHGLIASFHVLDIKLVLARGIGMDQRTYLRGRAVPERRLSSKHSRRMWKFAEILALATDVLGTQDAAEHWLCEPALTLDQRRPIDLLTTPMGIEVVETFLRRIDHGVYV